MGFGGLDRLSWIAFRVDNVKFGKKGSLEVGALVDEGDFRRARSLLSPRFDVGQRIVDLTPQGPSFSPLFFHQHQVIFAVTAIYNGSDSSS